MAIDSRAKRQSILGLPTPGGGITQSDRQTLLLIYGGIEAGELTVVTEVLSFTVGLYQTLAPEVTIYSGTATPTVAIYETVSATVTAETEAS